MSFTSAHIAILERHEHHWIGLRDVGVMQNLDAAVIDELQQVYNEALGPEQFSGWCKDCVIDLVRLVYVNFEQWRAANPEVPSEVTPVSETGGEEDPADGEPVAPPASEPSAPALPKTATGKGGRASKTKTGGNEG